MALTRDTSGALALGGVLLDAVVREHGTPSYVYDLDQMQGGARALRDSFEGALHLVCYAIKANTAGGVVRALAAEGCGADVVSGAELRVALACGIPPDSIVYSGVAKRDDEIDGAILSGERGIGAVQIESVEEIERVAARARAARRRARVSLRVNPGLDLARVTHAHIATGHDDAKFGVPLDDAPRAVDLVRASEHLELVGMGVHAGSQFMTLDPYLEAARVLFRIVRDLRQTGWLPGIHFVDAGGGFGVDYDRPFEAHHAAPTQPADFVRAVRAEQGAFEIGDLHLYVEPGRSLVAPHGVLLARVLQRKVSGGVIAPRWLLLDAGMNDLIRPALYQARHRIVPLQAPESDADGARWRVVGPVCESSDDFGEHVLPAEPPDAVAILDCGAYGYTMSSHYNGRPLPMEVFVRGGRVAAATQRENIEDWVRERSAAGR